MAVTVRNRGQNPLLVRAIAQISLYLVNNSLDYQDFFNTLAKSLFLTAHSLD